MLSNPATGLCAGFKWLTYLQDSSFFDCHTCMHCRAQSTLACSFWFRCQVWHSYDTTYLVPLRTRCLCTLWLRRLTKAAAALTERGNLLASMHWSLPRPTSKAEQQMGRHMEVSQL